VAGGDVNRGRETATENAQQYVYARDAGHLQFLKKAKQCEDFFDSYPDKQWEEQVAAALRRQGRPALTIGKILPTLAIIMGEQIQNSVDIAFRPKASGNEETASALDKVWTHVATTNHLVYVRGDVFDDGAITSRGYYDIRMDFSDNVRGDVRITRANPKTVVLDPDGDDYDPRTWNQLFVTPWITAQRVGQLYGEAFGRELEKREKSAFAFGGHDFIDFPMDGFGRVMGFNHITAGPAGAKLRRFVRIVERQHRERKRVPHFIEPTTGEKRPVPPTWDRERVQLAIQELGLVVADLRGEMIRWTVSADDILLHDEISPYRDFTIVPYFPFFLRGRTIGFVEGMIGSQMGLNKTRSQELHIVNTTANSGWKLRTGSLKNMTRPELEQRGAESGLVLELDDPGDAEKIQPNQVPTGLDRVSQKFDEDLLTIPNVGQGMRSTARADTSGKALRQQEVRGTIGMSRPFQNLVRSEEMLAAAALHLVQTFYTDERLITVVGQDMRQTVETVAVNQVQEDGSVLNDLTAGEYAVTSTTVPQREQHEDTVFDQALAMRELGIHVSDEVIIANSRIPNKREILDGLTPSEEEQQAQQLELESKQLENEKAKASIMETRASALERVARAKRSATESEDSVNDELALERFKIEQQMQLEREKMLMQMEIEREKMRRQTRIEEMKVRRNANA
jgi:hypothetical protein